MKRVGCPDTPLYADIEDIFSYYALDYQERPKAKTELRWVDRVTLDGTWSGNIFDFYRIVIKKLFADLKVPFKLESDKREDDTLIHKAIREAFVNAIVHADFTGRSSILIVKRPDMFGFRNPGLMRIPIEVAIKGGDSDCRNRTLHKMFMLIGYGERAGSGIPKIYSGWNSQDWTKPLLYEKTEPEQTLLELRMINLLDTNIIEDLKEIYQDGLNDLSKDEMTILTTAYIEEGTNHKRILELLDLHPSDISNLLRKLVDEGLLTSQGQGRGTIYQASGVSNKARVVNDKAGGVIKKGRGVSFYDIDDIPNDIYEDLTTISNSVTIKQRVNKEVMNKTILSICNYGYFSLELLAKLLNRDKGRVKKYITQLIKDNKLEKLYEFSNHPKQAYTSKDII